MAIVIRAEEIGKRYSLTKDRFGGKSTLVATLSTMAKRGVGTLLRRRAEEQEKAADFWAISGLSFEIEEGDRIGIIGRNGAGKSTLLKILSRITLPTTGRISICGKMASLLEVGTGFHPELTGRENIYLNGAILGMLRADIRKKFDEIVAFAEIEKFLDLPVKHYSSGMYTRLGFAIAAHLDPDILIIDEVLAVGDIAFQEKCLKKLNELGKKGRTVLFVSHDMGSVLALCNKGLFLDKGKMKLFGPMEEVVAHYLKGLESLPLSWSGQMGDEHIQVSRLSFIGTDAKKSYFLPSDKPHLLIEYEVLRSHSNLMMGFSILNLRHQVIASAYIGDDIDRMKPFMSIGKHQLTFPIDMALFHEGEYLLRLEAALHNIKPILYDEPSIRFSLFPDPKIHRLPRPGDIGGMQLGYHWRLEA